MQKFLSPRSRAGLGGILAAIGLLVMIAMGAAELKRPNVALVAGGLAVLALLVLSHVVTHGQPDVGDLIEEAKRRMHQEKLAAMEWRNIEFRRSSFHEMKLGRKSGFVFLILSGVAFCLGGLADFAGLIPPMKMVVANGTVQEVSQWMSGIIFFGMGLLAFIITSIIRVEMVDKIDEEARRLFNEMDGKDRTQH